MKLRLLFLLVLLFFLGACGRPGKELSPSPTAPLAEVTGEPDFSMPTPPPPPASPDRPIQATPTRLPATLPTPVSRPVQLNDRAGGLWETYGQMNIVDFALARNAVWIGTWQGVFRFDLQTESFDNHSRGLKTNMPLLSLAVDQAGHVWIGSGFAGLAPGDSQFGSLQEFDGEQWQTHVNLSPAVAGLSQGGLVSLVAVDQAGHLWSNTTQGFAEYDGQSWQPHLEVSDFKDMAVDGQGRHWFCGTRTISVFDGSQWTHFNLKDELPLEACLTVAGDRFGTMWFGGSNGLYKFDGQSWTTYTPADGLAHELVQTIAIDQAGQLWIGHGPAGAGVSKFDGNSWTTYTMADGLPSNEVNHIAVDQAGQIWFGTSRGLSRFTPPSVDPLAVTTPLSPTIASRLSLLEPIQPSNAPQLAQVAQMGRGVVKDFVWSPDGRLLAVAATSDLFLYDPATLRTIHRFGTESPPVAIDFSPDGSVLAAALADNSLSLWNVSNGTFLHTITDYTDFIVDLSLSPDGRWLAFSSVDGLLQVWDISTEGDKAALYTLPLPPYGRFVFSPDGRWLATGGGKWNRQVQVWDLASGEMVAEQEISPDLGGLAFSPDSQKLLLLPTGERSTPVLLWDFSTGEVARFQQPDAFSGAVFSPDGLVLATGDVGGQVQLWELLSGDEQRTGLGRHPNTPVNLAFSPDGRLLASAGETHLKIWDLSTGALQDDFVINAAGQLRFSADSKYLAFRRGGTLGLVYIADGEVLLLPGHSDLITSLAVSADNKWLAVGDWAGLVHLGNLTAGQFQFTLDGHVGPVGSLVFSPDDRLLASGGINEDHTVRLWETDSWDMTEYFADDTDYPMQRLTFSPDSTILAGGGLEGVILWDVTTGEVRHLNGHSKPVLSVAFSPDGERLASGSFDETVIVWDVPSGQPFQTLPGHTMGAASLIFSPGGRWLISGDQQQTIRAWSVETGLMLQTIEGRGQDLALGAGGTLLAFKRTLDDIVLWDVFGVGEVTRLTGGRPLIFSPDSRLLVSGSEDGIATLWGVQ